MLELFKSIGLKSDPFTTSPNVDKFYPATEHRQCLEGLELSVRLRRGLSVIRGGIGVGKTTVSRKLMEIFKDESDTYEFHLIHDPKFESELVFLKHIIDLFGIKKKGDDVQSCRNIVENYLLKRGVEEEMVIVLIVDEGQNLPEQMIDVFRTLLNFETDEYKLMQLIIFGQPEMTKLIRNYPNFEDRIAFNFELGPVSLEDTRGLIDYRIKISGEENQAWFSDGAIKVIHEVTDGFPRKMTQLCHQLLLAMIGEERESIDAEMVKRVVSGDTPDAENLKKISSSGEFDDLAVNKLLDVLRKKDKKKGESPVKEETVVQEVSKAPLKEDPVVQDEVQEPDKEDLVVEETEPEPEEKVVSQEEVEIPSDTDSTQEEDTASDQVDSAEVEEEIKVESDPDDDWIGDEFDESEDQVAEEDAPSTTVDQGIIIDDFKEEEVITPQISHDMSSIPQEPFSSPGEYDHGFDTVHTLFDPAAIGVHVDGDQLSSVLIGQTKGFKTLLSYDINHISAKTSSLVKDPASFVEKLLRSKDRLKDKFFPIKELHGRAMSVLDNFSNTYFSHNDEHVSVRHVSVGKDAKKDKKEIVKFTLGKKLSFHADDAIMNISTSTNDKDRVAVGLARKSDLEELSDQVVGLGCDVRDWMPTAQALFNAYKWNYQDQNIASQNNIILHIGHKQSVVVTCQGLHIASVDIVFIGYDDLLQSLKENKISENPEELEMLNVPASFLTNQGITTKPNKDDAYLRPIFDLWSQEIERVTTRIKRFVSINDSSKVFISGYAGKINNIDVLVSSASQVNAGLLNPIRNLTFSPYDSERNSIPFHPTILTPAIGSTLGDPKSITVLPPSMMKNNNFRWVNRALAVVTVLITFYLGFKSFDLINDNSQLELNLMPAKIGASKLGPVEDEYSLAVQNKKNVGEQIKLLKYDIDYFDRVIAITRFLSNRMPAEVTLERMSFQQGWEKELLKMQGRALQSFIEMEDENKRIVRMVGNLEANPALKDRYFNNLINIIEDSQLFASVEVVSKASDSDLGPNNIQFDIKCVF
ncbi:MAG: AAA family ATPase [Candidatus Neomarinimicrobiota bacterium]